MRVRWAHGTEDPPPARRGLRAYLERPLENAKSVQGLSVFSKEKILFPLGPEEKSGFNSTFIDQHVPGEKAKLGEAPYLFKS